MNILIITYSRLPEGDAEAVRLLTFGKILRDCGNDVSFVGMGFTGYLEEVEYTGFNYISLRKNAKNKLEKIYNYIGYNRRLKNFIKSYILHKKIDVILIADLPMVSIHWLKGFCRNHNIQLLADSVEWYSPEQFKYGLLSPSMVFMNIENKFLLDKNIKIIAISKYLRNYFIGKGCRAVRIPVVLDVKSIPFEKQINENKLSILYAGSPGRKDYVYEMLRGVLLLNETEMNRLRFIFAGFSFDAIKHHFSKEELNKLNECVEFLGRIERKEVLKKLSQTDFTVLLRASEQRYAMAGFPTKVVESLATATPVILNLSSDLGDYIKDMHEGLIVEECSAEAFSQTLKRVLMLEKSQIEDMKRKARLCAENNFDYRLYKEQLTSLLVTNSSSKVFAEQ
ncbi:glycosyltransferase [Lysinibacillus sp. LZ02]|uniref:glycosyltransferase n=1 Tax=Lysinibacillus sp. LZ02 TaxID=3420668 RepID=UPI003D35E7E6